MSYSYDAVGNLTNASYPLLGFFPDPTNLAHSYQYDTLNRLTNLVVKRAGSSFASFFYRLDRGGRRTNSIETMTRVSAPTSTSRTFDWQYDAVRGLRGRFLLLTTRGHYGHRR